MRRVLACLAAACLAVPAAADPLPSLVPSHDVSGTFLFTTPQGTQTFAIAYSRDQNAMRLTPQAGATAELYSGDAYILYDFNANDAKIVMPQLQRYFEQPALVAVMQRVQNDVASAAGNVTAGATETIAGYPCTDYTSGTGNGALLCVTADGVVLKLAATNGDSAVAEAMSYDGISADEVELPAGYAEMAPPSAAPAP